MCVGIDTCECNDGYYGLECETWDCYGYNYQDNATCSGNGDCVGPDYCSCDVGFQSEECNIWKCNGIPSNSRKVCNKKGDCIAPEVCECDHGWCGENCELKNNCVPTSRRDGFVICSGHGNCFENRTCICYDGYYGDECTRTLDLTKIFANSSYTILVTLGIAVFLFIMIVLIGSCLAYMVKFINKKDI